MKTLGNIIWFLTVGLASWLGWVFAGLLWCITIIGIPFGKQCFKLANLSVWPFGKEIIYPSSSTFGIANIIWILLCGWELAVGYIASGLIFYITIIGIPFGKQCFKLAKLSFMPFGAEIR